VHRETDNLEAFDHYLRGGEYKKRFTKEANAQARQMFERAIELDSRFALAYAELALTHVDDWCMGWSQDPQSLDRALEFAQRAIALDESLPLAHRTLGHVYLWKKQHGEAIAEVERAVALDPNDAEGYAELGRVLAWAGRPQEADKQLKTAMRLNPCFPVWYLYVLGQAYAFTGRYEDAIDVLKRALIRNPDFLPTHVVLAFIYGETGREDEARAQVAEILRISPHYSVEVMRETVPIQDQAALETVLEGLSKAGLK
jgi:adenylate cyclase